MSKPTKEASVQRSRDDPKEKKPRKPSCLKDRKTSSRVTFGV